MCDSKPILSSPSSLHNIHFTYSTENRAAEGYYILDHCQLYSYRVLCSFSTTFKDQAL